MHRHSYPCEISRRPSAVLQARLVASLSAVTVVERGALIVQDEPRLRRSLRTTVSAAGFTVVADVAGGNDALRAAALTQPDVILLDIDLTGSRGLQLLPELLSVVPNCAFLVLSSFDTLRFAALEAGAYAVISKSDLRELRRCLDRLRELPAGAAPKPPDP